jgi:hypothetical protein
VWKWVVRLSTDNNGSVPLTIHHLQRSRECDDLQRSRECDDLHRSQECDDLQRSRECDDLQ